MWTVAKQTPTLLERFGLGAEPIWSEGDRAWYAKSGDTWMTHPGLGVGLAGTADTALQGAAVDAANAIAADPNYCSNVGVNGSSVNSSVHAFKVAWNANVQSGGDMTNSGVGILPYNGQFDQQTVNAMVAAIGDLGIGPGVPAPCAGGGGGGGVVPGGGGGGGVTPAPSGGPSASTSTDYTKPILVGAGVLSAGLVGWALYRRYKRRHHK